MWICMLQLQDSQCGMLLLRHCHVTRMNFLSQTVASRLLESAAAIHDTDKINVHQSLG